MSAENHNPTEPSSAPTTTSRSHAFFRESLVAGFTHRTFTKAMGFDDEDLQVR